MQLSKFEWSGVNILVTAAIPRKLYVTPISL